MNLSYAAVVLTALFLVSGDGNSVSSSSSTARVVVLLPAPDPCKCAAQENVSVTWASQQCAKPGTDPVVLHDCFRKHETPTNPPIADPHGRCTRTPLCPVAPPKQCSFRGFDVTIFSEPCVTHCCAGATVELDGVHQGSLAPGGHITQSVHPGLLSCNNDAPPNKFKVMCGADGVVYEVTVSFRCSDCTANGG